MYLRNVGNTAHVHTVQRPKDRPDTNHEPAREYKIDKNYIISPSSTWRLVSVTQMRCVCIETRLGLVRPVLPGYGPGLVPSENPVTQLGGKHVTLH